MPSANQRLAALDGLRGLAAVSIVLLHVSMFNRGDARHPDKTLVDHAMGELRLGLVLFFVLSGFLLYRGWARAALAGEPGPRLRTYAVRRLARILPAYWLAVVGIFALLSQIDYPLMPDLSQLPIFLGFAQNYLPETANRLDPPMWSLVVEMSFYVALPLLGWLALRLGTSRARQLAFCGALGALGIGFSVLAAAEAWPRTATATLPLMLPYFAAGMAAAILVEGRAWSRRTGALVVLAGVLLVVADAAWHADGTLPLREALRDAPGAVGFALIVAGLVAAPVRARVLRSGPAAWLGTVSFGLYLWHFPAILLLRAEEQWEGDLLKDFGATLALATAAATASWFLVERPAIRLARRIPRKRTRLRLLADPTIERAADDGARAAA